MREKLRAIFEEYGKVAIGVYLVIFGVTISGFAVAITSGVEVEGAAGGAGTIAAAWVATKLTQPLRIAATLVLTPFAARVLRGRWKG